MNDLDFVDTIIQQTHRGVIKWQNYGEDYRCFCRYKNITYKLSVVKSSNRLKVKDGSSGVCWSLDVNRLRSEFSLLHAIESCQQTFHQELN